MCDLFLKDQNDLVFYLGLALPLSADGSLNDKSVTSRESSLSDPKLQSCGDDAIGCAKANRSSV